MLLKNAKILVIDDDTDVLIAIRLLLKSLVREVVIEKKPTQIPSLLTAGKFDVVILDMNFNSMINTGNEGLFWLKKIHEINADLPVILITAYGDIDLAIKSLKTGAEDFIVKPWKNEKLVQVITEILKSKKSGNKKGHFPNIDGLKIIGDGEEMQHVFLKIEKVAPTDANVLILGENGTGKDLIARAIHEQSLRKEKPFVKVDIGSLTDSIFESELFGYKKGAFTGAEKDKLGFFESADGGTLFLDEIGNITLRQQAKLLSVLQNRQIIPLGSTTPVPIDIRLICATNSKITELASEDKFRKDLFYRINTVEFMLPPLRERGDDVVHLANYFLEMYAEKYLKSGFDLEDSFISKIKSYKFPGNIRELQYAIERAVIMADSTTLSGKDLLFSPIEKQFMESDDEVLNLEMVEKNTILKVIEKNNGNISRSAKELGLTRTALYRRINKYGI